MSAPRRDSSQSPDPASGHGMGGSAKNGGEMMTNGPVVQPGDYDQWRSHSVYSHNGGFGPLTTTQPAPIPGDYMTNYYTASPYTMNDHHGGWTTAAPAGYYHPQGLSPPVSNQYMEHMTLFGGGPAPGSNSFFYNYFSTAPTNGSDYNAWGGPSIIPTPRSAVSGGGAGSKHSEFYYPMMDGGGYTHYIGTDIVGGNTNGDGRLSVGQAHQPANTQFGYLEQGVNRMSVYDDVIPGAIARTGQASGPYGGSNGVVGTNIVGHQSGGGVTASANSSSGSESKKKSWATIASQPAKPNSGYNGGPFAGFGKGKGRIPIGGVPGSASTDSGGEPVGPVGGFWPSPVQSTQSPTPAKQDNTPVSTGTGNHSQRSYGGGLVRNTSGDGGSAGGIWPSTNSAPGKSAKTGLAPVANTEGIQTVSQQSSTANGSGNSDSENGEYNNNEVEKGVSSVEVKPAIINSLPTVEKADSQKPAQRCFFDKSAMENDYNPKEFTLPTKGARYFVIKSYSEDDIHRSIKYGIWCSTEHGNKRLDSSYREREGKGPVYLLFSVNGSGHFCGVAQMTSPLDYSKSSGVWAQDKWKGQFTVKWIYVKDVPNAQLRHIRLENNENKPVTNSRDTQEVPPEKGRQVLKIIHQYRHTTSLFDDFGHYEKRQEEEDQRKSRRGGGADE